MIRPISILLLFASLGFCGDAPNFEKIEQRGGWNFETTRLNHGVRLNRRTWIADPAKVTYDVWMDGKHLWTVDFDHGRAFFTPVRADAIEHITSHLETTTKGQNILDLLTPDRTGYIASIIFDQATASVTVSSESELNERIESLDWNHTTPYSGPPFSDPKSVFSARMPTGPEHGEQGVAPQSATRSESDSGGNDNPKPESDPRPR